MISEFFTKEINTENIQVQHPILEDRTIELWIKREDLIHPEVSGNKFRKLKYNLLQAKKENHRTVLTYGGAYSNHILATAVASKMEGFKSIGVIRGEELGNNLEKTLSMNLTLHKASQYGMKFVFFSRDQYRNKNSVDINKYLKATQGDFYEIPEGGTNKWAVKGCEEILTKEDVRFDYICSCVGTGGTLAGIINTAKSHQQVLGYPALKGDFLKEEIQKFVKTKASWDLVSAYHFGGYAKHSEELIHFINDFKQQSSILLDPIYTGKMIFGILDQIQKNEFSNGSKLLAIHTGGLQGIEGFNQQLEKKNKPYRIAI